MTRGQASILRVSVLVVLASCGGGGGDGGGGGGGGEPVPIVVSRTTGISPLAVFYDATPTATTLPGVAPGREFRDVECVWDFGDTGPSGTATWANGSNPGQNSKNAATGVIAAHVYRIDEGGGDQTFTASVACTDGTNTAIANATPVTIYDPQGANGFPGTSTVCVAANSMPVAGGPEGCPPGAAVVQQAAWELALEFNLASGKRILFRCGDTFIGAHSQVPASTSKFAIGAYGACVGTGTNRPVLEKLTVQQMLNLAGSTDGRLMDLFLDGKATGLGEPAIDTFPGGTTTSRMTILNVGSEDLDTGLLRTAGTELAIVDSSCAAPGGTPSQGPCVLIDLPATGTSSWVAILGNSFSDATEATVSARLLKLGVIANNTVSDAIQAASVPASGSVLALHALTPGFLTEKVVVADNLFHDPTNFRVVLGPRNTGDPERLRNIVVERNLFDGGGGGPRLTVSGADIAVRNNIVLQAQSHFGIEVKRLQTEPLPTAVELYHNTCYTDAALASSACIVLSNSNHGNGATNSIARNNLAYYPASFGTPEAVRDDNPSNNNTVSNNTAAVTDDPLFVNGSGTLSEAADFTPGPGSYAIGAGASVPVWSDFFRMAQPSPRDLGAVVH